jgi:hypothetical protein
MFGILQELAGHAAIVENDAWQNRSSKGCLCESGVRCTPRRLALGMSAATAAVNSIWPIRP